MASITWPIPYDGAPNRFEVVGRYLAQTILMERFIELVLLSEGIAPLRLHKMTLATKIARLKDLLDMPDSGLDEWRDLPILMLKVKDYRNAFAHRMLERSGDMPPHYGQTPNLRLPYKSLSQAELYEQERAVFVVSELARQLAQRVMTGGPNPSVHFRRKEPIYPAMPELSESR